MFDPSKIHVSDQPCAWNATTGKAYRCNHVHRLSNGEVVEARLLSMDGVSSLLGNATFFANEGLTTDEPSAVSWTEAFKEAEVDTNKSVLLQEIAALKREVQQVRIAHGSALREVETVKANVTGWFSDAVNVGDMTRTKANEALRRMGLDPLTPLFHVTGVLPNGVVIADRKNVEAEDGDGAIDLVKEALYVQTRALKVRHEFDWSSDAPGEDGDESRDFLIEDWAWHETDDVDELADGLRSIIEWRSEEQDD